MNAARKFVEDDSLLRDASFDNAWRQSSSQLVELCRLRYATTKARLNVLLVESGIVSYLPVLEKSGPVKISVAALAFLFTKVENDIKNLAEGPSLSQQSVDEKETADVNGSHSVPWARHMLRMCRQATELLEKGEELVVNGVHLYAPPPATELARISHALIKAISPATSARNTHLDRDEDPTFEDM